MTNWSGQYRGKAALTVEKIETDKSTTALKPGRSGTVGAGTRGGTQRTAAEQELFAFSDRQQSALHASMAICSDPASRLRVCQAGGTHRCGLILRRPAVACTAVSCSCVASTPAMAARLGADKDHVRRAPGWWRSRRADARTRDTEASRDGSFWSQVVSWWSQHKKKKAAKEKAEEALAEEMAAAQAAAARTAESAGALDATMSDVTDADDGAAGATSTDAFMPDAAGASTTPTTTIKRPMPIGPASPVRRQSARHAERRSSC